MAVPILERKAVRDLAARTTEVYADPSPEGYRSVRTVRAEETISPGCAPTVTIRLADLYRADG